MENVTNSEFDNQNITTEPLVSMCDGRGDQVVTTTTCIFCEHDHAAVFQEMDLAANPSETEPNRVECDLGVIHNKRVELDNIQKDLDELMNSLNTFIDETEEYSAIDQISAPSVNNDESEKQDGPSEKELKMNMMQANNENPENNYYISSPTQPPEINWGSVGPILQKHVSDLQKIHALNQMTNAVVQRIRNVAYVDENILKTQPPAEDCE